MYKRQVLNQVLQAYLNPKDASKKEYQSGSTLFREGEDVYKRQDLMIPNKRLSINEGAITVMGWQSCNDKSCLLYTSRCV